MFILHNAYHLVRIREGNEWRTAFNAPLSHYEYLVMPFGLTNAPSVFLRLVNDVLCNFLNRSVFYDLFQRPRLTRTSRLSCPGETPWKSVVHVSRKVWIPTISTIPFLGYIIEAGNIHPDPAKIETVSNWEIPNSRKKLQQFLGFVNFYRRFIRNYSAIAAPLTQLTSISEPFIWNIKADSAFKKLKELFVSAPTTRH